MRRLFWCTLFLMVLVGCSKDGFTQNGNMPYGTYPPVGYAPPPTNIPVPGPGMQPPINTQIPPGYPQQFGPFAPIYNYFQQTPAMAQYWSYLWYQWQLASAQANISVYAFPVFWNQYCSQQWNTMPLYQNLYSWYDVNVYSSSGYGYCGECFGF